ncbi:MAG: hypothetical protein M5R36_10555 [Deltaproteobacteria bacterium]|nr:hypothetical protein [Deltaproteobacteria bacterium]
MNTRRRAGAAALVVAVWIAFYLSGSALDRRNLSGSNEGDYLLGATQLYLRGQAEGLSLLRYLNPGYIMAPMQLVLAQPLFLLPERTIEHFRALNLLYFLALLAAVYALGAALFSRSAGLVAALLVTGFGSSREVVWHYNQLVLTALFVTLTLHTMFSSRFFSRMGRTVLAGACFSAALLSHRGSPLLMLGPPVALYTLFAARERGWRAALKGVGLMLLVALPPASGHLFRYYFGSGHVIAFYGGDDVRVGYGFSELTRGLTGRLDLFTSSNRWDATATSDSSRPFSGRPAWAWPRGSAARTIVFGPSCSPPRRRFFWFALFDTKNNDYIYPVLPLFALAIAGAAFLLPKPWLRVPALALLAVLTVYIDLLLPPLSARSPKEPGGYYPAAVRLWYRDLVYAFEYQAAGLGDACTEFLGELSRYGENGAAILYLVNGRVDPSASFQRDLMVCVQITRPDLPAAEVWFQEEMDDQVIGEVWILTPRDAGYDATTRLAITQVYTEAGQLAYNYQEKERGMHPPKRPPGAPYILPTREQGYEVPIYSRP